MELLVVKPKKSNYRQIVALNCHLDMNKIYLKWKNKESKGLAQTIETGNVWDLALIELWLPWKKVKMDP